ncbi:reticulon-4a isoform X2 [Anguilla anguilla]|uniref:reticulon-4a isoform X2 n=1 Tax=Anguilla anguilla TaxID=7936 RepID=UPI0015ADA3F0|nr:reticulon-4a isoform X2 [Anguilla anguilla]
MEGFDDQISSTTPSNDELLRGTEYGTGDTHKLFEEAASYLLDNKESVTSDPMDEDDIIDLAGGARAAIESHKAAMSRFEDAPKYTKYSDFPTSDPEPEADQDMGSFVDSTEKQTKPMGEIAETETPKTEPRNPTKESSSGTSSYESFFSSSAPSQPLMQSSAVVDLLYWRDVKKSGVVFGTSLFLLLSLTLCSIVSICSYATLALLSVTVTFRIYKGILQAVQKSEEGHPFKAVLDQDVALSQDLVHKYSDLVLGRINYALRELRRLFLVEDLVDSLKFAVLMWILTYVGALFNGLTLLILGLISAFSLPVFYEKYQTQIDHYCGLVNNQVKDIVVKIQDKVPGMKRKPE